MKNKALFLIACPVLLIITSFAHDISAQGPECCSRRAIIKSCTINDPMGIMGTPGNMEDMDPSADTSATVYDDPSSMPWLDPQESFCSSVQTTLTQILTRDCFHLQVRQMIGRNSAFPKQDEWTSMQKPANPGVAEYSFDAEMI